MASISLRIGPSIAFRSSAGFSGTPCWRRANNRDISRRSDSTIFATITGNASKWSRNFFGRELNVIPLTSIPSIGSSVSGCLRGSWFSRNSQIAFSLCWPSTASYVYALGGCLTFRYIFGISRPRKIESIRSTCRGEVHAGPRCQAGATCIASFSLTKSSIDQASCSIFNLILHILLSPVIRRNCGCNKRDILVAQKRGLSEQQSLFTSQLCRKVSFAEQKLRSGPIE